MQDISILTDREVAVVLTHNQMCCVWGVRKGGCVVDVNQKQPYPSDDGRRKSTTAARQEKETGELAPGITIVRGSTPRPVTLGPLLSALSSGQWPVQDQPGDETPLPDFPTSAPSAPPVPEELSAVEEDAITENAAPTSHPAQAPTEEPQEFDWLFEYSLEMDTSILNSPERLDGAALLYGPAVLKGYSILFGSVEDQGEKGKGRRTVATIVSGSDANAEVWGVLYRIPRRVCSRVDGASALLDAVHDAVPPGRLFRPVQASVRETYRNRDIECVTYIVTDAVQERMKPYVPMQGSTDMLYVQRVSALAKKLGLPDVYLSAYMSHANQTVAERHTERVPVTTMMRVEPDTEPLPSFREIDKTPLLVQVEDAQKTAAIIHQEQQAPAIPSSPWLIIFAVYLAVELLIVLIFAVLQGMGFGNTVLTNDFTLLGVPWLVLTYGLLGGCMSCIISLGRLRSTHPPAFIVITWFTRPYVGAALALFSYLFLTSGFFIFDRSGGKHDAFFLLVGALAGLCEGWIFQRQSNH
jgi:hypothetical protein